MPAAAVQRGDLPQAAAASASRSPLHVAWRRMMKCQRVWISGRVQGVAFRAYTRVQAEALGLRGHARNLPDGRVEVLACGEEHALEALLRWLEVGPPAARVDSVRVEDASADDCPPGFRVG